MIVKISKEYLLIILIGFNRAFELELSLTLDRWRDLISSDKVASTQIDYQPSWRARTALNTNSNLIFNIFFIKVLLLLINTPI